MKRFVQCGIVALIAAIAVSVSQAQSPMPGVSLSDATAAEIRGGADCCDWVDKMCPAGGLCESASCFAKRQTGETALLYNQRPNRSIICGSGTRCNNSQVRTLKGCAEAD